MSHVEGLAQQVWSRRGAPTLHLRGATGSVGQAVDIPPTGSPGYAYLAFDDAVSRESAKTGPIGFVPDLPERGTPDDVRRVHGFLVALKMEMDRRRVSTGSLCKDGVEVDIAIARGAWALAGVQMKADAAVSASDFRRPRKLREAAGDRFSGDVVLYDAETSATLGSGAGLGP